MYGIFDLIKMKFWWKIKLPSYRQVSIALFFVCCLLLLFAGYLQEIEGLEPCGLCMVQRAVVIVLGLLYMSAVVLKVKRRGMLWFNAFIFMVAILGIVVAWRQVWIEHLPEQLRPACGPDLEYMLMNFPLRDTIRALMTGSGECGQVAWRYLNYSMAEWMRGIFACFAFIALIRWPQQRVVDLQIWAR